MKQKIFNVVVYGMLAYSMLNAGYIALPVEYQAMIPQWNNLNAIVSGGATFLVGMGGLRFQSYLTQAKSEAHTKYELLFKNFLSLAEKIEGMDGRFKSVEKGQALLSKAVERNSKLQEVDLKAKLSNPMIDEEVKKLIEDVLE